MKNYGFVAKNSSNFLQIHQDLLIFLTDCSYFSFPFLYIFLQSSAISFLSASINASINLKITKLTINLVEIKVSFV